MTASLTGSLPKLEDLSVTSGLDKQVIVFLRDKGSSSSGVLYHMFANRAKIVKTLEPLKLGADELKLEEVAPDVAAAVLEHMVDEIEVARSSHMSAATTPPSSQTPAASLTSAPTDPQKARPAQGQGVRVRTDRRSQQKLPRPPVVGAEETLEVGLRERDLAPL